MKNDTVCMLVLILALVLPACSPAAAPTTAPTAANSCSNRTANGCPTEPPGYGGYVNPNEADFTYIGDPNMYSTSTLITGSWRRRQRND
jgi:hypothetical protein